MVTIPTKTGTGYTASVLPPRPRDTSFSAYEIGLHSRSGLQQVGAAMQQGASTIAQVEKQRLTDEGKIWTLNALSTLQIDLEAQAQDLSIQSVPSDYIQDKSFQDGSNPNTYTNKMMEFLDRESGKYEAPNGFAEDMWDAEIAKLRGTVGKQSIAFEANQRIIARTGQLSEATENLTRLAMSNPGQLDTLVGQLDSLITSTDTAETEKIEGYAGFIPAHLLQKVRDEGPGLLAEAALEGLIHQGSPLDALIMLDDESWAEAYDINPKSIPTIRNKAIAALKTLTNANINKAIIQLEEDVTRLKDTGFGLYRTTEAGIASVQNIITGGDLRILTYVPEINQQVQSILESHESARRVAGAHHFILSYTELLPQGEIADWLRDFDELSRVAEYDPQQLIEATYTRLNKSGAIEENMSMSTWAAYQAVGVDLLNHMTATELTELTTSVRGEMNKMLTLRGTDPAEAAMRVDSVASVHDRFQNGGATQGDVYDAINGLYETWDQPLSARHLLTENEATSLTATIQGLTDPDLLASTLANLDNDYGRHWNQVWSQLVTMENGLDSRYTFLGAMANTASSRLWANAIIAGNTPDGVSSIETSYTTQTQQSLADVESGMRQERMTLQFALTGGLPHRIAEVEPILETFRIASMLHGLEHRNKADDAFASTYKMMTNNMLLSAADRHFYMVPEDQTDETGVPLDATRIEYWVDESLSEEGLISLHDTVQLLVPGSATVIGGQNVSGGFSLDHFLEHLEESAFWVMADNGEGLMLVSPRLDQGFDYGMNLPVHYVTGDGTHAPVILPWSKFNAERPDPFIDVDWNLGYWGSLGAAL